MFSPRLCGSSTGPPVSSQSKHMQIGFRLIGDSKSTVCANARLSGCVSLYLGPVIHL